ncbi:cation:proton antiporter [Virgibacillus sp. 179-BFC.A HS]|uniref:Cation:proton antiporter n=1 Tax=Tigheibacillus jepli TaxID=3035914 RepID=A0ABU5CG21_9BACI|nr:cation:proton antiporter [Virgibacillus sp. 179-BFC.A HS]MDY0405253.1 cation:proton antiporter [Virgibacillus sp. 179-BFC.A HS]
MGVFVLGYVSLKTKFPNVILYILFGTALAKFLSENAILDLMGEIAIVLLFFLMGLEFNTKRLGSIAKKIWSSGLLDIVLNLGVTALITVLFGLNWYNAFLIGGIVFATSSSITAKLLNEKGRMANAETEFILGVMIFEDLVAPIFVAILIALGSGTAFTGTDLLLLIAKILGLAVAAIILGKTVFKKFEDLLIKLEDEDIRIALLVGIATLFGGLAIYLGLSEVLGAFLAGVMLAEIGKVERIQTSISPIQDLLLPLFFVSFGTTIDLVHGVPYAGLLVTLVVWSIVAKVLVGIIGGRWYGLTKRVSLRAGLSICARGEFSVVIAALAAANIKVFSGIYVIIAAFIGMLLFNYAPKITIMVYGKPVKTKKNLRPPMF